MKVILQFFYSLLCAAFFLGACTGEPAAAPAQTPLPAGKSPEYQIMDYPGKEAGEEIPLWVSRYLSGGNAAVEALPQYEDSYVFIGENSGTNINALRQWTIGFMVDQDFPQMVSSRVQARIFAAGGENPDKVYGRYFEYAVKNTFDSGYMGPRREADYWVLKRYAGEDVYEFFILVQIDKDFLKKQLDGILFKLDNPQVTREQAAAIERLKANFYEGF